MNKPIITANNNGIRLPEEYQLAIVKNGKIIDAGQHIADQAFRAVGQVYLDAIDKYIDRNQISKISAESA